MLRANGEPSRLRRFTARRVGSSCREDGEDASTSPLRLLVAHGARLAIPLKTLNNTVTFVESATVLEPGSRKLNIASRRLVVTAVLLEWDLPSNFLMAFILLELAPHHLSPFLSRHSRTYRSGEHNNVDPPYSPTHRYSHRSTMFPSRSVCSTPQ
jgi:hypothetical protein